MLVGMTNDKAVGISEPRTAASRDQQQWVVLAVEAATMAVQPKLRQTVQCMRSTQHNCCTA